MRVLEDYAIDERKLFVVYQKDRYQALRVRIFIKYLFSRLKEFAMDKPAARIGAAPLESRR